MPARSLGRRPTPGLRAVVTDLDGVLCDTETYFFRAVNLLLAQEGVAPLAESEARGLVGLDNDSIWEALRQARPLGLSLPAYTARVDALTVALTEVEMSPSPGAVRLVAEVHSRGLLLALASSADRARVEHRLRRLGLLEAFDAIVSRDEVRNPKPDPEAYLVALTALKVSSSRALALEDAPIGIRAARGAGCFTVALRTPWTASLDLSEAHLVVDSLEELDLDLLGAPPRGRG